MEVLEINCYSNIEQKRKLESPKILNNKMSSNIDFQFHK